VGARNRKLRGPLWSYRLELGFLFVAQRCVEILQRWPHQFDGLQHGFESLGERGKPRRRRYKVVRLACHLQHIDGLGRATSTRVARWGTFGCSLASISPNAERAVHPRHNVADSRKDLLTTCSHRCAMKRQTAILFLLSIACGFGIVAALYSLAQTHSLWSFIFLCVMMVFAVTVTSWYTAVDPQQ
jgi:hypothetical protein